MQNLLTRVMVLAGLGAAGMIGRPAAATCTADFNGDGVVNVFDLLEFLNCHPLPCSGDFNGNGILDGEDLTFLLLHWGPCKEDLVIGSTEAALAIADITDPTTAAQGLREFDVFVQLDGPDAILLSVFNANLTCRCANGFIHNPVQPGALPLSAAFWEVLGLTFDSFVTIGLQFGDDNFASLDPAFSEDDFINGDNLGINAGWYNGSSGFAQGRAGDYPGNRVRIATFTSEPGTSIDGQLTVGFWDTAGAAFFGAASLEINFEIGDLNGDGTVGTADLLDLLAAWGPCRSATDACPADLDGSGAVGTGDLLTLLAGWG